MIEPTQRTMRVKGPKQSARRAAAAAFLFIASALTVVLVITT